MAIIHMAGNNESNQYPEGAYCPCGPSSWNKDRTENPLVLYETHHGLCIKEREANGYHDSDFYMTVWDTETDKPKEILFATTRGWSYPCLGSGVDATPEIMAKYNAYIDMKRAETRQRQRDNKAKELQAFRSEVWRIAHENGLSASAAVKLYRQPKNIIALFGKRVRSKFKLSLRNQVLTWLKGESEYDRPLSPRQMEYI